MWLRQLLVFLLCSSALWAEVARIEIHARSNVLDGRTFGLAGPYEKLVGKVYFAVDPANPINQIIADIDKAPRNAAGKVEFSSDLYVLKPKQPERGNGAVLCGIPNRGRKFMLSFFNRASYSLDPSTGAEFGDGFLMRQGYTLVWLGWQWDPPPRPGLMRLYAPVARGIQGLVRADFVVPQRVTRRLLSDRQPHSLPGGGPGRSAGHPNGTGSNRLAAPADPPKALKILRGPHQRGNAGGL